MQLTQASRIAWWEPLVAHHVSPLLTILYQAANGGGLTLAGWQAGMIPGIATIDALADEFGAELVVLDPAVPLGLVGPSLELPYDVVLHGAEVSASSAMLGMSRRISPQSESCGPYTARPTAERSGQQFLKSCRFTIHCDFGLP